MKKLSEVAMVWNEKTQIANFDFADVVGYTQEEVREEVYKRFGKEIKKVTEQKLKWRENAKKKPRPKPTTPPTVVVKKKRTFSTDN